MSPLTGLPVDKCTVLGDTVVPDDHCALFPFDTGLEVSAVRKVVVKELEEGI